MSEAVPDIFPEISAPSLLSGALTGLESMWRAVADVWLLQLTQ